MLTASVSVQAYAATSPEAAIQEELLRQQTRERVLRQQQEIIPDVRLDQPESPVNQGLLPRNESPCFNIERIELGGDAAESSSG